MAPEQRPLVHVAIHQVVDAMTVRQVIGPLAFIYLPMRRCILSDTVPLSDGGRIEISVVLAMPAVYLCAIASALTV